MGSVQLEALPKELCPQAKQSLRSLMRSQRFNLGEGIFWDHSSLGCLSMVDPEAHNRKVMESIGRIIGMGILALPTFLQKYAGFSKLRGLLHRKKKALVVDDDPVMRKLLVFFLKRHGYECEEIENAFAATSWFENNHADLVTTDIHQGWYMEEKGKQIPRPTGIELLEYLAKQSNQKPSTMIVVSGNMYYSLTYSERAKKAGAKGLLLKPLAEKEFIALV